MYPKEPQRDLLRDAITAAIGCGIVTSFAISQGQHPLVGFAITGFAVLASLLIEYSLHSINQWHQ
jgi:hypothetical protein